MNLQNVRQGISHVRSASKRKSHEFLMLIMYAHDSLSHEDSQGEETLFVIQGDI